MLDFDRRYVLLPVLLGIVFVIGAFLVTESGRAQRIASVDAIQRSQERQRILTELQLTVTDAESAQRGFLLTGDSEYLAPYRSAKQQVEGYMIDLQTAYKHNAAAMSEKSAELTKLVVTKLAEIDATLAVYDQGRAQALALASTNFGQRSMDGVRDLTRDMRMEERQFVTAETGHWLRAQELNRALTAGGAVLNVLLILLAGALVTRDLRRRAAAAADLEAQVAKGTAELSELSTYLQQISERERSSLARELHDELGGLLISIKMDLSQLKQHMDLSQPDIQTRWNRLQTMLSAGIDLKRRVIEQLRPSLLDNMGLVAALQWQAGELSAGANLALSERYPETEPKITPDAAIALFRVAQESLTNIVKHAKARSIELSLSAEGEHLVLTIEDDGVGVRAGYRSAVGSHGIAGMKHRIKSHGGEFTVEPRSPTGTRVIAKVPLARVLLKT